MSEPLPVEPDSALPTGWLQDYGDKVDFERSFADLRGIKHFFAEAWKGKIRSEQLRFDTAWKHFDKANRIADKSEESIPNLVRRFMLNIWCFENAIHEAAPVFEDTKADVEESWIPELPEDILEEYPEVRRVVRQRKSSEAMLRLHLGQHNDAAELYQELIEETRTEGEGLTTFYYLGLAACEHNLGFEDRARRNLENAGLNVMATGRAVNRLKAASTLQAYYKFLKEDEEAKNWLSFLRGFECPQATREVYLKRADILFERCLEKASMLMLTTA